MEGYNVTLSFDYVSQLASEPSEAVWKATVRKIAMLKRHCFAAVFEKYFDYQSSSPTVKEPRKRAVIHYRDNESMYVDASSDRVVVIFSTVFQDFDDSIIGKVFMEVRERERRTNESLE